MKDAAITRSLSSYLRHWRALAVTAMRNTRLPVAVAVTNRRGLTSLRGMIIVVTNMSNTRLPAAVAVTKGPNFTSPKDAQALPQIVTPGAEANNVPSAKDKALAGRMRGY